MVEEKETKMGLGTWQQKERRERKECLMEMCKGKKGKQNKQNFEDFLRNNVEKIVWNKNTWMKQRNSI